MSNNEVVELQSTSRVRLVLGFAIVYVVWGSTYLAIRIGLDTLPPFLLGATRFLIAGGLLYTWSRWRGAAKPSALEWKRAAIIGGLLLFVGNGAVSWAEQRVSSGMTSLMVATVPLWMVLCEWGRGVRPRLIGVGGVLLGLVGVALLVFPVGDTSELAASGGGSAVIDPVGAIVLAMASLSWTVGSLYSRGKSSTGRASISIAMQMVMGGAMLMALSAGSGEIARLDYRLVGWPSLFALLYLIVFGSLIAFSTYMWLLRVATPTAVGTYAYANPVVAVLLGVLVLKEAVPHQAFIAMLVILGGVALVSLASRRASSLRGTLRRAGRQAES